MRHIFYSLLCLMAFTQLSFAKNSGTITGAVQNVQHEPIAYANVILYRALDSNVVKLQLSDEDGNFQFNNILPNQYYVEVSYVGLPSETTDAFELTAGAIHSIPTIYLADASNELSEVVVTAQKPLLELKPDKMVMNVENIATSAGKNAFELLRTAPGIVIDNNDNIALMGKTSVQIYIDGKPSPLTGAELANFLRSTPATDITAIEIITNPSAKFDAQGNAGIINIKMKKDKNLGGNATLNLGYAQGQRRQYNGSLSTNYRNKQMNVFGSYSHYDGANINNNDFYREQFGNFFDQQFVGQGDWNSHNFKVGTDFFINKKHTIGFLVNGSLSSGNWETDGQTLIGSLEDMEADSVLLAQSDNVWSSDNINYNLNYKLEGENGKSLNIDLDHGTFRNDSDDLQPNIYKDASQQIVLDERIFRLVTPTDIDITTAKLDYEMPLGKGKLGLGAKTSFITTDNTFNFFNVIDGDETIDETVSNEFEYQENVNAAYVEYSSQLDKLGIQAGLRMEQTNSEGNLMSMQAVEDETVERSYLDFFPSAGLTYQVNNDNSLQLNYSRRINRPNYQDLNPFESRVNELSFEKGNPFLRPEYANKLQLTHTYKYAINTSIGYAHTKDVISRVVDIRGENASFITWLNLAEQRDYSLNVSGSIPITEWWSMYTSLTAVQQHNKADFGEGKIVDLRVNTFNGYSQMNFTLPKGFNLEMSGFYSSPSIWEGTFKMEEMWALNAGVQKKILKERGTIKLAVTDIFRTQQWRGESTFGELYMIAAGDWDSRRVRVNFSYLFGNNQVKSRKRSTGLEEESSRVKSES
ncbi:MAG: TonB-dependent receptor [Bacteroidota bacterium]